MRILKEAMNELIISHSASEDEVLPTGRIAYELDTQVETDLELMIPDSYVNVPSEKIRLYKELDGIKSEDLLKRFTANLADRFGAPMPTPVLELIDVVRLRMMAAKLGLERIVLKKGTMTAWFISEKNHPFFQSGQFDAILQQLALRRGDVNLVESGGKLYFKVRDIPSVQAAARVLASFLV